MKKMMMIIMAFCILSLSVLPVQASGADRELLAAWQAYRERFQEIARTEEIEAAGYKMIEEQVFSIALESFGEEEVLFMPAMEKNCHRLALFIADQAGNILYKYDEFETNYINRGSLTQPTQNLKSVSFQDVNGDGLTDIILITECINGEGDYAGKPYKVGDVLFQKNKGFYRDWRISDKINRFSMNKNTNCIISFVRDGRSTEFLYTATTLDELLQNGFVITEEQCYTRNFEKLGRLKVVPGIFSMSEYDIFMIYLVDAQGDIIWSFQPMEDYDNLYSLKGITGKDVDGDGMKDLVVLARYSYEGENGELLVESDCAIYYQRTGGFDIDTGFAGYYTCSEEDTLEALVKKIREYWGWKV